MHGKDSKFTEVYLRNNNIPVDDKRDCLWRFSENSTVEVNDLLDRNPDLDAIVFANDSMAIGGYRVLYSRGLLPGKDIMVTGFDDDRFSVSLNPPLTTVEASSADLTYKAVMNAYNYINGFALEDMSVETHLIQKKLLRL